MVGPEGRYTLEFSPNPNDEWEGCVHAQFPSETTCWPVYRVDDDGSGPKLEGMAGLDIWNNSFWFSLWPEAHPPRIDYWGNQVLWRSDAGEAA